MVKMVKMIVRKKKKEKKRKHWKGANATVFNSSPPGATPVLAMWGVTVSLYVCKGLGPNPQTKQNNIKYCREHMLNV